ncbi:MAG: hypothetical protein ACNA8N_07340, partial [Trueperaceae bacterium]
RRWAARMRASGYRWSALLEDAAAAGTTGGRARAKPSDARGRQAKRPTARRRAVGKNAKAAASDAAGGRRRRRKRGG